MWTMCKAQGKAQAIFPGLIFALVLAACSAGPDYVLPSAPEEAKYKELKKGWKRATPRDDIDRGPWWTVFKDSKLDSYESHVDISNQNVAAAEAAYRQAHAIVKEAQAGLFPTVAISHDATREHYGPNTFVFGSTQGFTATVATLEATGTWNLDLWGKIRRMVESDASAAQASNADLANAKLSAQAMLATAYYNLLAADALEDLLNRLVKAFRSTLVITENQYNAGTVSKADVATAKAVVYSTESQAIAVGITRAQMEHAIAILMGRPPADLTVPHTPLGYRLPNIPPGMPSALLERRPDIAAAERAMQQQNALIGVATAAFYPDVTLTGVFGFMGPGGLALALTNEFWSIGVSTTQTLFNAGLFSAQVEAAKATYDQSVATYRQTVLTGFQQVDDQLAAIRILAKQQKAADEAVKASQEEYDVLLRQYRAGTVNFTAVDVAQETLLTNSQAALAVRQSRFLAAVALIQALGGGWDASQLPSAVELETRDFFIPPL
jgi:NodT family efflux transporter outer membrane factor (OMF) lipoprotein